MKKLFSLLLVVAVMLSSVVAFASAADFDGINADDSDSFAVSVTAVDGYINGTNVNLRSGPGTTYSSLGQLDQYDTFQDYWEPFVYANGYYWCRIKMLSGPHSGESGWVAINYLTWY
jgi:hypothetical protein